MKIKLNKKQKKYAMIAGGLAVIYFAANKTGLIGPIYGHRRMITQQSPVPGNNLGAVTTNAFW